MFEFDDAELQAMENRHLADARADVSQAARRLIRSYVEADALLDVYAAYGEKPYEGDDLAGKLAHAESFGNSNLDIRHIKPRSRLVPELPKAKTHTLNMLGEEVGMFAGQSMLGAPLGTVVVHGTYNEGMRSRITIAKQHVDMHQRTYGRLPSRMLALASERPLTEEDRGKSESFPHADTEWELMNDIIKEVFKPMSSSNGERDGGKLAQFILNHRDRDFVLSLNAPADEGRRYPNTADTQRYAAKVAYLGGQTAHGDSILGITASVYSGFQQLDLMRTWGLPFGSTVSMASYYDPDWTQPAHIGQEVNSVFDQATLLMNDIAKYEAAQPLTETVTIDLGKRS